MNSLVEKIIESESVGEKELWATPCRSYTFLNPVSYLSARENPLCFLQMDGIFADGSLLAKAVGLRYGKRIRRRSFDMTSLAGRLFHHAEKHGKSVYLVGGTRQDIAGAAGVIQSSYPALRIAGSHHGYLWGDEVGLEEVMREIVSESPSYVIAGMGVGRQEEFLVMLRQRGYRGVCFTCGGFFSQLAGGGINYYPRWVDKANLRFAYRFLKERHTRRRYVDALFKFPLTFIRDAY